MFARRGLIFPVHALAHLVQLTCLRLEAVEYCDPKSGRAAAAAALEPLQALTRLAGVQVGVLSMVVYHLKASMLSGASQLTRLVVRDLVLEPGALAGKGHLQHPALSFCMLRLPGSPAAVPPAGTAQVLLELQHLTQLTHLHLACSFFWCGFMSGATPALRLQSLPL